MPYQVPRDQQVQHRAGVRPPAAGHCNAQPAQSRRDTPPGGLAGEGDREDPAD